MYESLHDLVPSCFSSRISQILCTYQSPGIPIFLEFPAIPLWFQACLPLLLPSYLPGMSSLTDGTGHAYPTFKTPFRCHLLQDAWCPSLWGVHPCAFTACCDTALPLSICWPPFHRDHKFSVDWDTFIFPHCIPSTQPSGYWCSETRQVWHGEGQPVTQLITWWHLPRWIYHDSGPDFEAECLATWLNILRVDASHKGRTLLTKLIGAPIWSRQVYVLSIIEQDGWAVAGIALTRVFSPIYTPRGKPFSHHLLAASCVVLACLWRWPSSRGISQNGLKMNSSK